jgi:G:T-mismatch repair DNA endonuclease (very short patch repair protein)
VLIATTTATTSMRSRRTSVHSEVQHTNQKRPASWQHSPASRHVVASSHKVAENVTRATKKATALPDDGHIITVVAQVNAASQATSSAAADAAGGSAHAATRQSVATIAIQPSAEH